MKELYRINNSSVGDEMSRQKDNWWLLIFLIILAIITVIILYNSFKYQTIYTTAIELYRDYDMTAIPQLQQLNYYKNANCLLAYLNAQYYMGLGEYDTALNELIYTPYCSERQILYRYIYYEPRVFECIQAYREKFGAIADIDDIKIIGSVSDYDIEKCSSACPIIVIYLSDGSEDYCAVFFDGDNEKYYLAYRSNFSEKKESVCTGKNFLYEKYGITEEINGIDFERVRELLKKDVSRDISRIKAMEYIRFLG